MPTDTTATCPHGRPYGGIEQCGECRRVRATAISPTSPKAETKELETREHEYRAADVYLRRLAREWLDDGTARDRQVALKAFDAAARWARLALEIRQQRIEIEHDQWLVEQKRILSGGH